MICCYMESLFNYVLTANLSINETEIPQILKEIGLVFEGGSSSIPPTWSILNAIASSVISAIIQWARNQLRRYAAEE